MVSSVCGQPDGRDNATSKVAVGRQRRTADDVKVLEKDIFILGQEGDGKWACTRHEFRTVSSKGGNYQTSKERPLAIDQILAQIGRAKADAEATGTAAPLVIRFRGEHYTAYAHKQPRPTTEISRDQQQAERKTEMGLPDDSDEPMLELPETTGLAGNRKGEGRDGKGRDEPMATPPQSPEASTDYQLALQGGGSQEYALQQPWKPGDWDGDVDMLRNMTHTGPVISHELKCELQAILDAGGDRKDELIGFLDNTVGQLSRAEAEWLRCRNLKDGQEVATFMLKYELSEAALRQWQAANRQRNECFNGLLPFDQSEEHKEHEVPSQESEFVPDSMELSASEEVPTSPPVTRQAKGKRNHTPTPMVKKHVPGAVVNAKNDKVPLKKTKGSNPPIEEHVSRHYQEPANRICGGTRLRQ
ncbi:hypothetical protein V7S43_009792 [Phytophthora oleae]|uniref:Uncharacterized protein n=1 Tax=Phytophthora oleae TaxID=2107226 RepID=A0ABD3FDY8_9STRA